MKTILIVQSEPLLIDIFRKVLAGGYRIVTTTSPEEALDAYRQTRGIDLLITDVVLPVISGMELAGLLRAWAPRLRVILTAETPAWYWSQRQIEQYNEVASDYVVILEKPFYPEDLRLQVRSLVGFPEKPVEEVPAPVGSQLHA